MSNAERKSQYWKIVIPKRKMQFFCTSKEMRFVANGSLWRDAILEIKTAITSSYCSHSVRRTDWIVT